MNVKVRLMRHFGAFIGSGYGALFLYNEMYRLDNFKSKLELKMNDNAIKVPVKINNLITEVMNDMKIKDEEKNRIKPFICKLTDTIHLGCMESKTGPYIGIPFYFSVEEDSTAFTVWVDQVQIPQDIPETQTLKQSVLLSENAKKFAIARELYGLISSKNDIKALLPLLIMLNFSLTSYTIQKFGKFSNRQSVKLHGALVLFAVFLYVLLLNVISFYINAEVDLLVCNLGSSYVQGGIEYYEKMLEKNKTVKKFNKNSPFTNDGDFELSLIKNPQMPVKNRLIYLNEVLSGKNKNPSPWNYIILPIKF